MGSRAFFAGSAGIMQFNAFHLRTSRLNGGACCPQYAFGRFLARSPEFSSYSRLGTSPHLQLPVLLSRIHAIEVERLDLKPLIARATDPKRVEVNSLHLSVGSFLQLGRRSTASIRLSRKNAEELAHGTHRTHGQDELRARLQERSPHQIVRHLKKGICPHTFLFRVFRVFRGHIRLLIA